MADTGITGGSIAIMNKEETVSWVTNYDIPVVADLTHIPAAL
jgi:hypothetical protein